MSSVDPSTTREEKDSLGTKEIPAHVYYGIQTARAAENYPISGMRAHPTLIKAFGMVKEAAAEANRELGLVDQKIAGTFQVANHQRHGAIDLQRANRQYGEDQENQECRCQFGAQPHRYELRSG